MASSWPVVAQELRSRSTVVPAISTQRIPPLGSLGQHIRATLERLERFNTQYRQTALPALMIWCEASASSALEHLHAPFQHIAIARLAAQSQPTASLIVDNIDALEAALQHPAPLCLDALLATHHVLMRNTVPTQAGRVRNQAVWLGGTNPQTAAFVPPPCTQVPAALADLKNFLQRTDIDPLTQAAVAHAQYETIHPHTDGNGRTGRALIASVLKARGTSPEFVLPISSGLLGTRFSYVEALTQYRRGDPLDIIELIAVAAHRAISNAKLLHQDLQALEESIYAAASRVSPNFQTVTQLCLREPVFTAARAQQLGVPLSTAYRIIQRLETQEVLAVEEKIRGQSVWSVKGLTQALDAFLQRARRPY